MECLKKKKKLRLPSGFEYGVKRCLVFQAGDELVVCRFFFFNEENKAKAIMNPRKNKVLQETTLHTSTVIILVI